MRSRGLDEADKGLLGDDLTELEQYLLDSQELIKIRGKNGKMVPILVPEDAQKPMEFITSTAVRRAVGVKTWNTFVFGNTGEGVIRAYDSLKEMCAELNLGAPERITSVSMRKYIATLSQVIDMKDHELEWLCSHLGHTSEIHKLHYRSTSGFIERVNIGKLMVLQDLNIAGHFKGQRLQDIDIEDISDIMNNQGIQEPPNAQRNQEQQEAASSSAATSSASTSSAATSSASTSS
ncbi:uncharacterized protein LOC117327839, partial [Pecten maximus]|uniref:uncharacterized protein LOC117327839 n=1 Tax=Pecten maximus TaxID=6579 RepID=UPI0014580291